MIRRLLAFGPILLALGLGLFACGMSLWANNGFANEPLPLPTSSSRLQKELNRVATSNSSTQEQPLSKSAESHLIVKGLWQQGELLFCQVAPGSEVEFLGHRPLVMPDGRFVIGLDRDAPAKVTLTVITGGQKLQQNFDVKPRAYDVARLTGVADKFVNPPKTLLERIAAEARLVASARKRLDATTFINEPFAWPLAGRISGVFGSQRFYNGVGSRPHYGLDIAAPVGAAVHAPQGGLVTLGEPDLYYSGGTVIVDHGQGVNSTFMHLSKVLVKPGQHLRQGDLIGEVGATGRVTGPHLDWRMNWFDQHLDTQRLVAELPQPNP